MENIVPPLEAQVSTEPVSPPSKKPIKLWKNIFVGLFAIITMVGLTIGYLYLSRKNDTTAGASYEAIKFTNTSAYSHTYSNDNHSIRHIMVRRAQKSRKRRIFTLIDQYFPYSAEYCPSNDCTSMANKADTYEPKATYTHITQVCNFVEGI